MRSIITKNLQPKAAVNVEQIENSLQNAARSAAIKCSVNICMQMRSKSILRIRTSAFANTERRSKTLSRALWADK